MGGGNCNNIGGGNTTLEVPIPDCLCGVGITRIYFTTNIITNNVKISIVLSTGQTVTSPPINGTPGPAPILRVQGTILQYQLPNGTWQNLFDFSSITGGILFSDTVPHISTTSGSIETLNTAIIPANTLKVTGDTLIGRCYFDDVYTNGVNVDVQKVGLSFFGAFNFGAAVPSSYTLQNGKLRAVVDFAIAFTAQSIGVIPYVAIEYSVSPFQQGTTGIKLADAALSWDKITIPNFNPTIDQTILAQAISANVGDVVESFFQIQLIKKLQ